MRRLSDARCAAVQVAWRRGFSADAGCALSSASHTGSQVGGSGGRAPRSVWLSSGLWKSLPREASRSNSSAVVGVARGLGGAVAAGHDLDAAPAVRLELGEERVFLVRRELVARRMRDHGDAAGVGDPASPRRAASPSGAARSPACLRRGSGGTPPACRRRRRVSTRWRAKWVREISSRVADVLQRAFEACRRCRPAPGRRPSRARAPRGRRASRRGPASALRRRRRSRGRRCARWCRRR